MTISNEESKVLDKPEYIPTKLNIHIFQAEILERKIIFQALKMKDSVLIYVIEKDHLQFNDLSMAIKDRYNASAIGTQLMGNFNDAFSQNAACKLSTKLGKVVFLSCNVDQDKLLLPLLEKQICDEMKKLPDMF